MKSNHFVSMLACCFALSFAETEVGGILHQDTRWNAKDGPFHLTSDLLVPSGVCLTISPGSTIIFHKPSGNDTAIEQLDDNDAAMISMTIKGALSCVGRSDKRISFLPDSSMKYNGTWYGIVFDRSEEQSSDITFTDITGAYCGVTIKACAPTISNSLIEYNHIGIYCTDIGSAKIFNCIIAYNNSAGIRVINANPIFTNNIIVANRNNGIWCDGSSSITLTYNCIFGNSDGNFLECDPDLGRCVKKNGNGDSIDVFNNIFVDPIFAGSVAESNAEQKDITVPTEKTNIRNQLIAAIIHDRKKEPENPEMKEPGRYHLSKYSPCINTGDPAKKFMDKDGTRNDMGICGGPDFFGNH